MKRLMICFAVLAGLMVSCEPVTANIPPGMEETVCVVKMPLKPALQKDQLAEFTRYMAKDLSHKAQHMCIQKFESDGCAGETFFDSFWYEREDGHFNMMFKVINEACPVQ